MLVFSVVHYSGSYNETGRGLVILGRGNYSAVPRELLRHRRGHSRAVGEQGTFGVGSPQHKVDHIHLIGSRGARLELEWGWANCDDGGGDGYRAVVLHAMQITVHRDSARLRVVGGVAVVIEFLPHVRLVLI